MSCMGTEHSTTGCNMPTGRNPRGTQSGGPGTTVRVVPRDRPRTAIVVSQPNGTTTVVPSRQPMPAPQPLPSTPAVVVVNRPAPAPNGIEVLQPPYANPLVRPLTPVMEMPRPSSLTIPAKVMEMPRPSRSMVPASTMTPPAVLVAPKTPMVPMSPQGMPSLSSQPPPPAQTVTPVGPTDVSRTSPLDMPVQPSIAKTPLAEVLSQAPAQPMPSVPSGLSQRPPSSSGSSAPSSSIASTIAQAMTPPTEFKAAGKPFAGRFRAFGRACWTFQNMPPAAQVAVIAQLPPALRPANLADQVKAGQPGADSAFIATVAKMSPDAPAAIIDAVAKVATADNTAPAVALVANTKPAAGMSGYRPAGAAMSAPSSLSCGEAFRMLPRDAQLRVMLGPAFFASESAPRDLAVMLNQNQGGDPANAFLAWVRTRYTPNSAEQATICGMIDAEARAAGLVSAPAGAYAVPFVASPDMLRAVTPDMVQTLATLCPNVANAVRRGLADVAVTAMYGADRGGPLYDRPTFTYAPAGLVIPPVVAAAGVYSQADWDGMSPEARAAAVNAYQAHADAIAEANRPGTAQQVTAGITAAANAALDAFDRDARNTLARRNADAANANTAAAAALARQVQEDNTRLAELRIRLGQTTDPLQQSALAQQVTDLSTRLAIAQATQTAQASWWSQQSGTTQAAVVGGGLLAVAGAGYLALKRKG